MPFLSVRRSIVQPLAVCLVLFGTARGFAGTSNSDFTNNRTQWDAQIRDIRSRRSSGSSSSEPYPGYARERAAEIFRQNHRRTAQGDHEAQVARDGWNRQNADRAQTAAMQRLAEHSARKRAEWALEEAARLKALEKLYAAANAGDADALIAVAARETEAFPEQSVEKYGSVNGPRRTEALWAAVKLIRSKKLAKPGSKMELWHRGMLEELSDRGDVIATRERALLSNLDGDVYLALQYSTKAALAGDKSSQRRVVKIFAEGKVDGISASPEKVYAWCRDAAEAGDVGGQVMLGLALFSGNGLKENLPEALGWFQKAIAADSTNCTPRENDLRLNAMNLAGTMLLTGNGAPEDKAAGFALIEKAADQGSEGAALNAAECCLDGDGVAQDPAMAVYYFERAAERGNAKAARAVTELYFSPDAPCYDEAAGLQWTRRFSTRDPYLMITYAQFVHDGRYGLHPDAVKAKELLDAVLRKFPEDGYALNAIGVMTLTGLNDFTPDPARGIDLLKKAYERGSAISARSLQKIYTKGMGVPADPGEASHWQELAVAAGAPEIPMD